MRTLLAAVLLAAATLAAGCGGSDRLSSPVPPAPGDDQTAVADALAGIPWLTDDGLFALGVSASGAPETVAPLAPIEPLYFWRTIDRVEHHFDFDFEAPDPGGRPTRVTVDLLKTLHGSFNIAPEPDSFVRSPRLAPVQKPLLDLWRRRARFERVVYLDENIRPGPTWALTAVSGVRVTSVDMRECVGCKTMIASLRLQSEDLDLTITDPLELVPMVKLPPFTPGAQVRVTVETLHPDDVVFLMTGRRWVSLDKVGQRTYAGIWIVPPPGQPPVVGQVGVNALSHGTLFDDRALYDSDAWIMPYVPRTFVLSGQ
jgi:hypothetical protein